MTGPGLFVSVLPSVMPLSHPVPVLKQVAAGLLSPPGLREGLQRNIALGASIHQQLRRNHLSRNAVSSSPDRSSDYFLKTSGKSSDIPSQREQKKCLRLLVRLKTVKTVVHAAAQAQSYCWFNRLSGLTVWQSTYSNIGGIWVFIWGM